MSTARAADATAPPPIPPIPLPQSPARQSALPPMPDHFSYSAMTTFQDCPRRWCYRYLRRAPPECISASLLMGGAVHAALAQIHHRRTTGEADDPAGAMDAFDIHWLTLEGGKEVIYAKGEDAAAMRRQAEMLVGLYLSGNGLGVAGRIVAVERPLRISLPGLPVPVVGRADWLAVTGGALVIGESKTSRSAFSAEKQAEAAGQLSLYAEALAPMTQILGTAGKTIAGRVVVLRRLKRPRIETYVVPLTAEGGARMRFRLCGTWSLAAAAHAAGAFPARPSWQCRACPYRRRCAAETGGIDAATPSETEPLGQ